MPVQTKLALHLVGGVGGEASTSELCSQWPAFVNSVHPGIMPPMRTSGRTADPAIRAGRIRFIPMRRPGEVDEVANAILFPAPDELSYITGRKSTSMVERLPYRRVQIDNLCMRYHGSTKPAIEEGCIWLPHFSRPSRLFP
jgi:hypothetical protein